MCLAIPGEVIEIEGDHAVVDFGGTKSRINITFIPDLVAGDFVIVHVGYAIQRMTREEAEESLNLINEVLEA